MTPRPLIEAQDEDVRNALFALQRAAQRAKQIAAQTQTAIVVMRDGIMIHEQPIQEMTTSPITRHVLT